VPIGTERLRVSITLGHDRETLEHLARRILWHINDMGPR
jgi:7-keto-8-aminopelargonate synthetase-like enzyme